jgi:hypothetical protein
MTPVTTSPEWIPIVILCNKNNNVTTWGSLVYYKHDVLNTEKVVDVYNIIFLPQEVITERLSLLICRREVHVSNDGQMDCYPGREFHGEHLKLGHDQFLHHSFQFIIC